MQLTEANNLLAAMVKDFYENENGKFSKSTGIKAIKFVATSPEAQNLINIGDYTMFKKRIVHELNKQTMTGNESNVILAAMLKDLYTSKTGRCSKPTGRKVVSYIMNRDDLQNLVNIGDYLLFEKRLAQSLNQKTLS